MSSAGVTTALLTLATAIAARGGATARRPRPFASGELRAPQRWEDIPRTVLRVLRGAEALAWGARRRRSPAADLPALLEGVASRLRAGGSLGQALVEAAPPGPGVLADQWRRTAELVPVIGAVAALQDWAGRADQRSVRLAAAALTLAARTGGSPARAVDGVAATLRSRLALEAEIRALSSQARASAVVIALAPAAFGVLAGLTDPRIVGFLTTPAGVVVVSAGLGLDALGAWWMARLCRGPSQ
ncbi:MAG: type II secretion system F family protein [Actinobacteria bacterium]|nr:type II secretion system F family protein [Actinomycetota bacterium]